MGRLIDLKTMRSILILVIFSIVSPAFSSDDFEKRFESYYQENYLETIFIHTDKDHFFVGERILFKVYCLEKLTSKPSLLSKVAYVELLNDLNEPKLQARIELSEGSGYGELYIPATMISGNYTIRGYTRWMRNYGPESFYHSMITIINPFKKLGLGAKPVAVDATIDFFPEGGKLIDGLVTKVVFHAKNADGYALECKGKILSDDSLVVGEFVPIKGGLGHFSFTADKQKSYKVELLHSGGEVSYHDFLTIETNGTIMKVDEATGKVKIIVKEDVAVADIRLFLTQSGEIIEQKPVHLSDGISEVYLDFSKIDEGISCIYLVKNSEIVQSRNLFKNGSQSNTKIQLGPGSFANREKILAFIPDSGTGEFDFESADLSISASNSNKLLLSGTVNLSQYLLLENELLYVHNLNSYFDDDSKKTEELINCLLVAYSKEQQLNAGLHYVAEYRGPLATGYLLEKYTENPAHSRTAYLSVPGKHLRFYAAKSQLDGKLIFETRGLYGKNDIVLQTDYTKDSAYSISIDNPYSKEYMEIKLPAFDIEEELESWIRNQSQQVQVQNANLRFAPKLPLYTRVDSSEFFNEPTKSYLLDEYTRFVVMEEVMREYVAGVNVRKNRDGFHFNVLDYEKNEIYYDNPLMLLDGVPVFDADKIIALDPLKVERIQTVNRQFGRGVLDCKGIVNYTTYSGNLDGFQLNKHAIVQSYDGIQLQKTYSFPEYISDFARRNPTPDFRNTLFWMPVINHDNEKTRSFEFYTSDVSGMFEVTINGIDKNGNALSFKSSFNVSPKKIN